MKRQLSPEPSISLVAPSDVTSQYTANKETFCQILEILDPMQVSTTVDMGLNARAPKKEARPKGPTLVPPNTALKDAHFLNGINLTRIVKATQSHKEIVEKDFPNTLSSSLVP